MTWPNCFDAGERPRSGEVLRLGTLAGANKHLYIVLSLVRDALGTSVPHDVLDQILSRE